MPPLIVADIPDWLFEALGWVPAVVFPAASGVQLLAIIHRRSADGVSIPAWVLFAIANVCLFGYTEKYTEWESILGSLGAATLNACIVLAAFRYRSGGRNAQPGNPNNPARVEAAADASPAMEPAMKPAKEPAKDLDVASEPKP